ncbi:MAG: FAD-dependent oxidoreductase [Candidatus Nealsonbacteria bacterium]
MKNQKVAIIGAGICGLYLAQKLSERGFEVTVFEKNKKIGKETCSGLFSERILDYVPDSKNLIENQIEYALLRFPKKTIRINFSKKFFVMKHAELDKLVSSLAEKSGAKIIFNKKIDSFPKGFDKIIGCDGATSQTRKLLKLKNPEFRLGIQGFIFKKDYDPPTTLPPSAGPSSHYVETWPTEYGFLWKIPRGEEIEYGIIEKRDRAKKIFNEFLEEKKIDLKNINSALIPQGLIIPSNLKITLCGDSTGLTKPWSGGGVIWGLKAADILLKNFPDFLKYKKELKKSFLPKIIFSKTAIALAYFFGFKTYYFLPKSIRIESDFLL